MKTTLLLAAALGLATSAASAATVIYDETLTPQSNASSTTFFDDDNDFSESFDFSSVAYTAIDRFVLTLDVAGARDESGFFLFFGPFFEDWSIRVQGSDTGGFADDSFSDITGDGTVSFTLDAASDGGTVDAFANSVATGIYTFWLAEGSADSIVNNPSITISSAQLQVFGEVAPVPLPAGLPLLAGALGGLAFLRRKRG